MSCYPAQHEADHGEAKKCQRHPGEILEVLGETATTPQPPEGALNDPPFWQNFEPLGGVGAFDDFQVPRPEFADGCRGGGPLVAAIGEHPNDEGEEAPDLLEDRQSAITILDIGRLDMSREDQAERIDDDVPLLAFDLFPSVVARWINPRPPFSAPLTLWLSMIAAVGLASLPESSRTSMNRA